MMIKLHTILCSFLCSVLIQKSSSFVSPQASPIVLTPSLHRRNYNYSSTSSISLSRNANDNEVKENNANGDEKSKFPKQLRRSFLISTALAGVTNLGLAFAAPPGFKRISTQYIAALGDPKSNSGSNTAEWGVWTLDPGPRGVFLRDYEKYIKARNDVAPVGWKFDKNDWWLEEHGLIMEAPNFPLPSGKYLVTGGRLVTTTLEVDDKGNWKLENGSLYDVTHLPCRSARYTPGLNAGGTEGSPLTAKQSDFPVKPGAEMPKVEGCEKQDYAVIFVIGKEVV